MTDKTPAEMLRSWARAYRIGPKEYRFPSDPEAEFFPVDMEVAADELERLTEALEDVANHKPGTPGLSFPSLELLIASAVGCAESALKRG
jgi:hypothetical protein